MSGRGGAGGGRSSDGAWRRARRAPARQDPVAKDRQASAVDRDERVYARKRASQQRRRAQQDRSGFDPSPPGDDDWTIPAQDSDGLVRISPPTAVGETLRTLIQRQGWDERLRGATASSRWIEIVGEPLADRCEPVRLVRGTLTIRAENQVWGTQLRYMLPHLRERAEAVLGAGTVEEVTIVIGRLQGHGAAALDSAVSRAAGADDQPGGPVR